MSYHNYYQRLRIKAVQEFDKEYYEPETTAKCHKSVWKKLGCYIFGISYDSYLDYLKMDVSDIPETPSEALKARREFAEKLLERDKKYRQRHVRRQPGASPEKKKSTGKK